MIPLPNKPDIEPPRAKFAVHVSREAMARLEKIRAAKGMESINQVVEEAARVMSANLSKGK